jgi:hypothetical protein
MDKHFILGVHITNRMQKAGEVQKIFSEYGCNIRTRLGLHEASDQVCSPAGVILLELVGEEATCEELAVRVAEIPGVEVKRMLFEHP